MDNLTYVVRRFAVRGLDFDWPRSSDSLRPQHQLRFCVKRARFSNLASKLRDLCFQFVDAFSVPAEGADS